MPQPGTTPGIEPQELASLPTSGAPVKIICADYCPGRFETHDVTDLGAFLAQHRPEWCAVRWINIDGLTNLEAIRAIAEKYELHPLAVEDVLHVGQRPKCEDYPGLDDHPGRLFVIAPWVERENGLLRNEQVSIFLGRKTLVSFQENPGELNQSLLARIMNRDSRLRRNDASFLLYTLLDTIADRFYPQLETISRRLEELEEAVLAGHRDHVLERLHRSRRELMLLRRVVWPMRELINILQRDHHECLSENTRTYLRDVYDHVIEVLDLIESYRDMVESITEMHMTVTANRLNDIMKTLTVISTIFVPLTFLAGVYGMNMPIPENHYWQAYPLFWIASVVLAGGMLLWFRRRGWF